MAQTMVNFRMDENLKKSMEETCKEKRIPFEICVDPFYSESNMNYLRSVISNINAGKVELVEHDLIEEE